MASIDDDKVERILSHLDKIHDSVKEVREDHAKLSARMDALEGEREKEKADAKVRKDAEEKERQEKEAVDAAMRRADGSVRENLETIEKDRAQFADCQMRADAAYQAWGKTAPPALLGEALRDFRIRLLSPLKPHSKVYKDSALHLVGDDAALRVIEDAIINDAVEASSVAPPVGAPLREVVTHSEVGHVYRKFIGDPSVTWSPFMGGATRFGRINRPVR